MLRIVPSDIIPQLLILEPTVFSDHRGEYIETWNARDYGFKDAVGKPVDLVEDDVSRSHAGVLRGLHGDEKTWKLVQCLWGEIYLVVVDMRRDSPTFLSWQGFTLNDQKRHQVLIPPGCANGHYAVSDCLFSYKQSHFYGGAESQFTVRYNDPRLGIEWPGEDPVLSDRDRSAPDLAADGSVVVP